MADAVKALEARLGVRLLQRTTRQVSPTPDGEAYYQRCVSLIADLEEAEGAFAGAKPSGLIRIDVHGTQARYFLLPGLPGFLQMYPGIRLHIGEAHQPLDMIQEGFDCVLADARQVKHLPGRPKHDPGDSRWLAACFERGAVTSCFVATPEFRIIREHTRYQRDLTAERTREKQRAEKLLESAAIKLSSVITDLHGVTGRDIMDHLIAGERNPKTLAQIDAVFVTVEPNGGSPHPSGKPLLFAYLGIHPNHP